MSLQAIVEQTVTGLGYELVETARTAGGVLRVTIDRAWPPKDGADAEVVTVDDCEKVTRQLQFALEVETIEYRRLEVSSPGIDRPLRDARDFERFAGQVVDITLKQPVGEAGRGVVPANRRKFRGKLERVDATGPDAEPSWQVVWSDAPPPKPGVRVSKKRASAPLQALGFRLDELQEARLAPVVDFKGRGRAGAADGAGHATGADGAMTESEGEQ